ncbi:hypothetical protein [Nostoc sp.]|uniref:hypothetical protein n=1 Tax=Nostoc sp. TaxID=1180 RepID=UPI002FFA1EFC
MKPYILFYTNKELYVHRPGGLVISIAGCVVYRRRHRSFLHSARGDRAIASKDYQSSAHVPIKLVI